MNFVLTEAVTRFTTNKQKIDHVYLHVQQGNDAIIFYRKAGFEEAETVENYYVGGIEPATAIILRKTLN